MNWSRSELKRKAQVVLQKAYWKLVLVSLILGFCSGGGGGNAGSSIASKDEFSDLFSGVDPMVLIGIICFIILIFLIIIVLAVVLSTFLFNPLVVGCRKITIDVRENPETSLSEIGFAFKNNYWNVVKTMFLMGLYLSLWSLLLVVPGIIKSYEYRMIPYLLAEDPSLSTAEYFAKSKQMMMGEKWNTFVLDWSFFGWYFLGIFTCGILYIFFVTPYVHQTNAELYAVLKQKIAPAAYTDPYEGVDTGASW